MTDFDISNREVDRPVEGGDYGRFGRERCRLDEQLRGIDSIAELIDDVDGASGRFECSLGVGRDAVEAFARACSVSVPVLLSAAFGYALSRFTGDARALFSVIGVDCDESTDAGDIAGLSEGRLTVVIDCADCDADVFVGRAALAICEALSHGSCSPGASVRDMGIGTRVVFRYVPLDAQWKSSGDAEFSGGKPAHEKLANGTGCHMDVRIVDDGEFLRVCVSHSDRHSRETVERLIGCFEAVLGGLLSCGRLSEIQVASAGDVAFQEEMNRTEAPLVHADILDAFAESLGKHPDSVLVAYGDKRCTYAQGAAIASAVAGALAEAGVQPRDSVAVLVPRSEWYLLAALGALAAGCAYVPMDDAYPDGRLAFMLSDTSASAVLVTEATVERARALLAFAGCDAAVIDVGAFGDAEDGHGPQPLGGHSFSYRTTDPDGTACILYTSGTTGRPKGSLVTRRAVASFAQWMASATSMVGDDIYGMHCSIAFDAHAMALYPPLCVGASLDVVPEAVRLDLTALNDYFVARGCTHTYITSQVGKLFAEAGFDTTIRLICFGGMKLGHLEAPDSVGPFESYGPTENLAISTSVFANERSCDSSVGRFVWNVKGYVLDAELRRVPTGAVGQLYLSGYQLAKGYLNRPEETAAAFVPNPFDGEEPGYATMYATGDMVRILPDGTVGFIGRRDSQVKIRGNRVETGEVEACIRQLGCVADVTVQAVDGNGSKELCAYVVARPESADAGGDGGLQPASAQDVGGAELYRLVTAHVAACKPPYMVPAFVVALDAIPLNANGKVDCRALPAPDVSSLRADYAPAESELQQRIAAAFEEVLGISPIGADDDFIRLGGDSLKAMRMLPALRDAGVTAACVLSGRTPRAIAAGAQGALSAGMNLQVYVDVSRVPLSEPQLNVYLDMQADANAGPYLVAATVPLGARYGAGDVARALDAVCAAHPILTSRIVADVGGVFLEAGDGPALIDLTDVDASELERFRSEPFDMGAGLARFALIGEGCGLALAAVLSHIVFDGMSEAVFERDLLAALDGGTLGLDAAYRAAAAFSEQVAGTDAYARAGRFFAGRFAEVGSIAGLMDDVGGSAGWVERALDADRGAVSAFAREVGVSLSALLAAAFGYALSRFTGDSRALFNLVDNGRDRLPGSEGAIGMFVNTLPVVIDCSDADAADFVRRVASEVYGTLSNGFYPFRLLARDYGIRADVLFQYFPFASCGGEPAAAANGGLSVRVADDGESLRVSVSRSARYSRETAERLIGCLDSVLTGIASGGRLSGIRVVCAGDIVFQDGMNRTEAPLAHADILDAFAEALGRFSGSTLVTCGDVSYTYAQGAAVAMAVADALDEAGVGPQDSVAVLVPRGEWYLLAALGSLAAGCAYVPMDDSLPDGRLTFMLADVSADAVLVTAGTAGRARALLASAGLGAPVIDIGHLGDAAGCGLQSFGIRPFSYRASKPDDAACIFYTSGSTGHPKGVVQTRLGVTNMCQWQNEYLAIREDDVYAMYPSCGFDSHLQPLLAPLMSGCCVDITPDEARLDVDGLVRYCVDRGVTLIKMATPMAKLLVGRAAETPLRAIYASGDYLGKVEGCPDGVELIDGYGPTENTLQSCSIASGAKAYESSVGVPHMNVKAYVLDAELRRVPTGAVGQLFLSGYQLARGYFNRPEESAAAFLPNPFDGDEPGYGRMYATGDMVRILPDGTIGFVGRRDSMVKIRGNRVETGEVEACIRRLDCAADVTVQAVDGNGSKELCAYVVPARPTDADGLFRAVTSHVAACEPSYMVPAFVIALDAIPLNVNGKVDRRALPKPDASLLRASFAPAETGLQQRIAAAFEKVLGIAPVGIDDDFIRLGGDSLKAIRMLPSLRDAGVTAAAILSRRTPRAIAAQAQESLLAGMDLDAYRGAARVPLSEPQLNVYLDIQANDATGSYLIVQTVSIDGCYGADSVACALNAVCAAHPILRSRIVVDGEGVFLEAGGVPELADLIGADISAIENFFSKPFDMACSLSRFAMVEQGSVPRSNLVEQGSVPRSNLSLAGGSCVLAAVFSHVVFDGMSGAIFKRDFLAALAGRELRPDAAYLRAAAFSEQIRDTGAFGRAGRFFDGLLCEAESIAGLVDDADGSAGWVGQALDVDRAAACAFARENGVSMSALLTAAFSYALSRFTGDSRALFNIVDNGRDRIPGAEDAIGMFVSTLPVVIDCANREASAFVRDAASVVYDAARHGFYPFRLLARDYGVRADVLFQYFPFGGRDAARADVGLSADGLAASNGDLNVRVADDGDALSMYVIRSARYSRKTVERLIGCFEAVLGGLLSYGRLSEIQVASAGDVVFQEEMNRTEVPLAHVDILDAFAESVEKHPGSVLVAYGDKRCTYAQGAAIASAVAGALAEAGVQPRDSVAVLVPRSEWYLLAALGALTAGCAYVPMDDAYPDGRLAFMLSDTSASAVLVTEATVERARALLESIESDAPVIDVGALRIEAGGISLFSHCTPNPESIACVLYTSGTTGRPKGSLITRKAILNLAEWYVHETGFTEDDVYGMYVSHAFDMHTLAFYPCLLVGALMDIVPETIRLDLHALNDYFVSHGCTHTYITSQVGKLFAEAGFDTTIRLICFGGMKLGHLEAPDSVGPFESYGPTENLAISTAVFANERGCDSSVGRFVWNVKGYVLDAELRRVPTGAVGQLYLSGYQLAKGYLNRPEETAAAFLPNPFDGGEPGYATMYATGDMVRILPDGTIGFIGRRDSQVKVRGNRVETGEVEACIKRLDCVADVTVQAIDAGGSKELCAYVVARAQVAGAREGVQGMDEAGLYRAVTAHVAASKPAYMVPAFVIALDAIPLNVNGKVDVRVLPIPNALALRAEFAPAETELQQRIASAFEGALGVSPIGIDDDFIRLGGDSLKAIRMLPALRDAGITAAAILSRRTPRAIAADAGDALLTGMDLDRYMGASRIPLSESQLNVYLDVQASGKTGSYLIAQAVPVDVRCGVEDVRRALNDVCAAHPILRSRIAADGEGVFLEIGAAPELADLTGVGGDAVEDFLSRPFDMACGLARFALTGEGEFLSIEAVFSHIVFDGMSRAVFKRDFLVALAGGKLEPDAAYLRAAAFSEQVKSIDAYGRAERFFDAQLCEAGAIAGLIDDADGSAGWVEKRLDVDRGAAMAFARGNSVSMFALLTVAFGYALSRFTGDSRALFNLIDNGRDRIPGAEDAIGMFASTLPVVIDCADCDKDGFVKRAAQAVYRTVQYGFFPFRLLAHDYGVKADVFFQYFPFGGRNAALADAGFTSGELATAIGDLSVAVADDGDTLTVHVSRSARYSRETAERLTLALESVLGGIVSGRAFSEIELASEADIAFQDSLNKTEASLEHEDVMDAFAESLARCPQSVLVIYEDKSYTYAQGAAIAMGIADALVEAGVKPQANVAVLVPRGEWYLLAALGALAAGCAYVPLDDAYPDERLAFMLADTSVSAVLATADTVGRARALLASAGMDAAVICADALSADACGTRPFAYRAPGPDDAACILYTSGTTGRPKGSIITRRAVANMSKEYVDCTSLTGDDVYGLYTSIGFDAPLVAMFPILIVGAGLVIVPEDVRFDIEGLNAFFARRRVAHTMLPTQFAKAFLAVTASTSLSVMLVGGDSLGEIAASEGLRLIDAYGPSECCAFVSAIDVPDKADPSSVGSPNVNTKVYVLDAGLRRVPTGAVGQLYLSGYQLAKGYLNRPEETAAAFVPNPFDGEKPGYERMYATGDMARILPDGTIGFIGRRDSQVKIRGNRVETGEVEACIRQMDVVTDVTVQAIDAGGFEALCAYVVADPGLGENDFYRLVTAHVAASKPSYMVPAFVVALDAIPLNANGKVDRRALPPCGRGDGCGEAVPPATYLQARILGCVNEVLGVAEGAIGVDSDLVRCGLDSLSAIRLVMLIKDRCRVRLSAADILRNPSVERFAAGCSADSYRPVHVFHEVPGGKSLVFVHPGNGGAESYAELSKPFEGVYSFSCVDNRGLCHLDGGIGGYREAAKRYVRYLLECQPDGPYYLGGWCIGGIIAYEMAAILCLLGHRVEGLYLLNSSYTKNSWSDEEWAEVARIRTDAYLMEEESRRLEGLLSERSALGYRRYWHGINMAGRGYIPSRYDGDVVLFKSTVRSPGPVTPIPDALEAKREDPFDKLANGFEDFAPNIRVVEVPFAHDDLMDEVPARMIADAIIEDMARR